MSVRILIGDVREKLAELPADHFDCVVTSPPYWGLRDYDVDGQIGLEPTLGEHLAIMVEVMRAVRRVLKPTGTLWLNYGDCYATSPNGRSAADTKAAGTDDRTFRDKPFSTIGPIYDPARPSGGYRGSTKSLHAAMGRVCAGGLLKPKDLCMVPNRLAIALQDDGWWVRSEIIWAKPNPMPESIGDRPATAHEKVWLLTKSARYAYDAEAVRQTAVGASVHGLTGGSHSAPGQAPHTGSRRAQKVRGLTPRHKGHTNHTSIEATPRGSRNLRNWEPAPLEVWPIATRPFPEAHFATFPPELAERCIKAGCPAGGAVLDPFGGSGTVGIVADRLGLDCTLIELNPGYAAMAEARIKRDAGMFAEVVAA
jgi:DNA modification methylase